MYPMLSAQLKNYMFRQHIFCTFIDLLCPNTIQQGLNNNYYHKNIKNNNDK